MSCFQRLQICHIVRPLLQILKTKISIYYSYIMFSDFFSFLRQLLNNTFKKIFEIFFKLSCKKVDPVHLLFTLTE